MRTVRSWEAIQNLRGFFDGLKTAAIFQGVEYREIHNAKSEISVLDGHLRDLEEYIAKLTQDNKQ